LQIYPAYSGGHFRSYGLANALSYHGLEVFVYSLAGRKNDYVALHRPSVQRWPDGIEEYVDRGILGLLIQYASSALALPPVWRTAYLRAAAASPNEMLLPAAGDEPEADDDADHAPAFWSSVASAFIGNNAAIFELFNEPYPDNQQNSTAAWTCWRDGGTCSGVPFQAAGMQTLVSAVRAGATNVIALGGVGYSDYLSQWLAYKPNDPLGDLAAAWHVYNFNACNNQLLGHDRRAVNRPGAGDHDRDRDRHVRLGVVERIPQLARRPPDELPSVDLGQLGHGLLRALAR
jgi:cellulase (glycosyl hydrolase family 5)